MFDSGNNQRLTGDAPGWLDILPEPSGLGGSLEGSSDNLDFVKLGR